MSHFPPGLGLFARALPVERPTTNGQRCLGMTAIAQALQNGINGAYAKGESHLNGSNKCIKDENMDDDDVPLAQKLHVSSKPAKSSFEEALANSASSSKSKKSRSPAQPKKEIKTETASQSYTVESDDDVPLSVRMKEGSNCKIKNEAEDEEYQTTKSKKSRKEKKVKEIEASPLKRRSKSKNKDSTEPKRKKTEDEEEVWKWWEEEKKPDGIKWNSLVHKGPLFAPDYEPLPENVHFRYEGQVLKLQQAAEEVATFYAKMLDHDYTSKEMFNTNFFKDWRKTMTNEEREKITELKKCDFREIFEYFKKISEERKAMSKEEKNKIKEKKEEEAKIYGYAFIDGHKQKIGNFRIEPPGLFRGRGGHPKMGKLKKRVLPENVIINCSKDNPPPEPPPGHKWKEVRHDNTVTWLCSWTENVLGQNKYIMLNPSSKIKGEKDMQKFETARRLKSRVDDIRANYTADFKSKEMRIRQRAVAMYFIDKLALRAGNEKDVDEAADTVGCCSLRCEHIKLHEQLDGQDFVVEFDFLGKDSIRYQNKVPVEKRVFKNLQLFMENKDPGDDLFDRLDTSVLNAHLRSLMPDLTAKVFRTYNASITLQQQLDKLTRDDATLQENLLSYNRANRQVAILCNHQRAIPKSHEKSMENLEAKIRNKKSELKAAKEELEKAKGDAAKTKAKKKVERLKEQLKKLKIQRTDKDENKQIALGTSKLNYLDPRITVAWCKKHNVPLEKIFNRTQREKFRWAIDMADEDYVF
ncbi:hypothetical protein AB6A40_002995 [Gnathostoma spinigerum]|uniref:DNA topoisomerase I n=1 Tax=Gnathostoma spinigerum TaxID=75299 RepID=A0ABD6EFV5_9BILA